MPSRAQFNREPFVNIANQFGKITDEYLSIGRDVDRSGQPGRGQLLSCVRLRLLLQPAKTAILALGCLANGGRLLDSGQLRRRHECDQGQSEEQTLLP